MLKKIALAIICFCSLYLLGGCKFSYSWYDSPEYKANFTYEAFWYFQGDGPEAGESVPDEYSFLYNGKIYVYSVVAQEITQALSSKDGRIDAYAINDDYIFFITGANTLDARLWKYDRMADTCEMFTEIPGYPASYYRLALYQDYVFCGIQDIIACPIDGDTEEDSISLLAQFPEGVSAYKMRDIVYQGWRIRRERDGSSNRILFIKDEENAKVILTTTSSYAGVWLDINRELIRFTKIGTDSYYQREDEQEKHSIDCLENTYYYGNSGVVSHKLAFEDGKIICLIPVSKNPNEIQGLSQIEVEEDILVEIDPEEGLDRIIYSTRDNKTRIIGYRGGKLYLIEGDIIYRQDLEGGDREEVFNLRDGSVALYGSDGRHTSIYFIVWGDNLIVRPHDGTKGMFTIPLSEQAEDSQEERN